MLNKQHVIVVGGGSFGISAALELRQRGGRWMYLIRPHPKSDGGGDPDPARHGLLFATRDSSHAFKFTPLLGKIIAHVLERRNQLALKFAWWVREHHYRSARFAGSQGEAAGR